MDWTLEVWGNDGFVGYYYGRGTDTIRLAKLCFGPDAGMMFWFE